MIKESYTLISGGYIQNPEEPEQKKNILIQGNKILTLTDDIPSDVENSNIIDAEDCIITPGLIDQHIHGGYGCNFNTADTDMIIKFLSQLPKHGITSVCPTIMTDTPENIKTQITKIKEAKAKLPENAAKIAGINIEGPFLNPAFKGAHPEELILKPTVENYRKFEDELIKIITIAPEFDENFELTKYLTERGVITSAGHTNADSTTFLEAVNSGLSQVTHLFNAMPPLHHRKPGIVGNSLINNAIYTEVIADHKHLHPDILTLILRSKAKSKIIFISDSLPLNQSDADWSIFGGQKIFKQGEIAVNEDGNFAGSLLFLDSVIKKNINTVPFSDLLKYCSANPAKNLGLTNLGCIAKGMTADITIWQRQTLEIKNTLLNGQQIASN